METRLPELGRFAEPALLILVSLGDGPRHGYAIMLDVESATGRPMGPGTLYAALARLEERGLIERVADVLLDSIADTPSELATRLRTAFDEAMRARGEPEVAR